MLRVCCHSEGAAGNRGIWCWAFTQPQATLPSQTPRSTRGDRTVVPEERSKNLDIGLTNQRRAPA